MDFGAGVDEGAPDGVFIGFGCRRVVSSAGLVTPAYRHIGTVTSPGFLNFTSGTKEFRS